MKRLLIILVILTLSLSVQAQDIELREDHPREYVVQEGDTLWDIAGHFLTRPWQWPAIWQANPQIDNPHLIFPGDRIVLEFVGGDPRLRVADDTRRLSPEVRREAVDGAITAIPYDAIEPLLRHPRVISADDIDDLPYVVANVEQRVFAGPGDRTYVRGMPDAREGQEVVIARISYQFEDRSGGEQNGVRQNRIRAGGGQVPAHERPVSQLWRTTMGRLERFNYPIIGYEMWTSAHARVVKAGDPAVLELTHGRREVMAGDYVLPVDYHQFDPYFHPRAMDQIPENARVLTVSEAYYGVGHYQIVAISVGTEDGVEPGHIFSAFSKGKTIRDRHRLPVGGYRSDERHVTLPDEYAGQIMVFRPFDRISYAIVMDGKNAIRADYHLDHPDRRL